MTGEGVLEKMMGKTPEPSRQPGPPEFGWRHPFVADGDRGSFGFGCIKIKRPGISVSGRWFGGAFSLRRMYSSCLTNSTADLVI